MYGKSYDAVTGLVGNDLRLPKLKAVVAQEPVWNMYNYLFSNEVPRPNVTGTPQAYNGIATIAPPADDTEQYKANAGYEKSHPECLSDNLTNNNNPDLTRPTGAPVTSPAAPRATTTPLFITQGFIENNTKPEDTELSCQPSRSRTRAGWATGSTSAATRPVPTGRLPQGPRRLLRRGHALLRLYLKGIWPTVRIRRSRSRTTPARGGPADLADTTTYSSARNPPTAHTSTMAARRRWPPGPCPGRPLGHGTRARLRATSRDRRAAPDGGAGRCCTGREVTHSYFTWSRPTTMPIRIPATPRVWRSTSGAPGNVHAPAVGPTGPTARALMFDENVSKIDAPAG